VEKMSKSLDNYVAVEDPPFEMFGKIMSVSDDLMWRYWLLLTDREEGEITALKGAVETGDRHPMEVKKELAGVIVGELCSPDAAAAARREFERVFSARDLPSEIPEVELAVAGASVLLSKVLRDSGLAASNSEARRLIQQGGVRVDGEIERNPKAEIATVAEESVLLRAGKRRFVRVRFSAQ